jgi:phosphate starvation-inducible PhoH-like protein
VVRHRLVSDIVDAYARWDTEQQAPAPVPLAGGRGAAHVRGGRRR